MAKSGMKTAIQAIPTEFDGVLYRSRTEARFAVYLSCLLNRYCVTGDIRYEPMTITLDDGQEYTPDFFVNRFSTEILYIEVKPCSISEDAMRRYSAVARVLPLLVVIWNQERPGVIQHFATNELVEPAILCSGFGTNSDGWDFISPWAEISDGGVDSDERNQCIAKMSAAVAAWHSSWDVRFDLQDSVDSVTSNQFRIVAGSGEYDE